MLNFLKNINKKSRFKPTPTINCDITGLVSYTDNPMTTELKYSNPLLCISIGGTARGFAYEVNLKNAENEDVGYLVAHVYNGIIEDFSLLSYTGFDYDNIAEIPITTTLKFGDSKEELIRILGQPDEDTSDEPFNNLYSIVYIRTINGKKHYFEYEMFEDKICAMHIGLSN